MLIKLLLLLGTLCPILAHAYPNYIGKGYHACLTCHYNPFGNGPLNDYGRGVAATALAGRTFISDKTSNEELSDRSGFLFNTPKNTFFRPAFDYRGMELSRGLETEDPQTTYINMQVDATGTFIFSKKTIATITYGVIPSNSATPGVTADFKAEPGEDVYFSREHYVGHRVTPNLGIYLGKMDKVFGIRVPDHTAYSRRVTGNNQYGATHGAVVHYGKEKFDAGIQYFVGDLEKVEEKQTSGFAGKYEHSVLDSLRLGISYLNETNDSTKTTDSIVAFIYKQAIGKGSSIMFEYGSKDRTVDEADPINSSYVFLQNHIYLAKGLYYMMTFEHLNPNTEETNNQYRISPGIQWMPFQRVELRFDLTNQKEVSTTKSTRDTWLYTGQVHLWF